MTSPARSTINMLTLSRHLFQIAQGNLRSSRDVALFAAANLMQDAVEAFLLGVADHINAAIDQRSDFDKYFARIDERLKSDVSLGLTELPFKRQLLALNRVRVSSKHQGVRPDRRELESSALVCKEFFESCCERVIGRKYWSINLLDILEDCETKTSLNMAQQAYDTSEYAECLMLCRRAIFLEFEKRYDISSFARPFDYLDFDISRLFCKADHYKQSKEWIDQNVTEPFQYIQLSHAEVDRQLMKSGIDVSAFWNIWRMTPAVYKTRDGRWLTRVEPNVTNAEGIEDRASYVLENTIDIVLREREVRSRIRFTNQGSYSVTLKKDEVSLHSKASKASPVVFVTPKDVFKLDVSCGSPALEGDGFFWAATYNSGAGLMLSHSGYVSDDDILWPDSE